METIILVNACTHLFLHYLWIPLIVNRFEYLNLVLQISNFLV